MNTSIELKNMEFFARHGCFGEERVIGGKFIVNMTVTGNFAKAVKTDNLEDALNYKEIYDIVREQMRIPSNLIENVACRVMREVFNKHEQVEHMSITIEKLAPPIGGKVEAASFILEECRDHFLTGVTN